MTNTEKQNLVYALLEDLAECNLNHTTKTGLNTIFIDYLKLNNKATPKKIVYREFMKLTPGHEYKESCPNCNSVFDYDELGKKHCSNCGQALDWSKND